MHGGTPPWRSARRYGPAWHVGGASRRIEVRLHGGSTSHGCAWLRCDGRGAQVRKLKDLHKFDCLRANKSTSAFGLEALNRPQTNTQTTAWDAAVMLCSQRRSPRRLQHCRRAIGLVWSTARLGI